MVEKEQYFVIHTTDDGTMFSKIEDIDEFLKELIEGDYGEYKFLDRIPDGWNEHLGCDEMILIRGKCIVPKHVEVVTKLSVDFE